MIRRQTGFTIVEIMITMAVFLLVIASASSVFTGLLTQFKQQSKISETNIEGIIGLDMLRRDIEHAGYGLPWIIPSGIAYNEASNTPGSSYNDCSGSAPCNAPKAIISGNDAGTNGSDYLVIKAVNIAGNSSCSKWTTLQSDNTVKTWDISGENLSANDRIIVISPGTTSSDQRTLIVNGASFYTTYGGSDRTSFVPPDSTKVYIAYGVDPDTNLRMPFNRADYSIAVSNVPSRCAPGTGVLTKTVISQSNGGTTNALPLLDCVADMQVIYRLDTNADGTIDTASNDLSALTAAQIRARVKEIRVYVLAHEGQFDSKYLYPSSTITVGEYGLGSTFNLSSRIGSNYANYRWKVYIMVIKPTNLG